MIDVTVTLLETLLGEASRSQARPACRPGADACRPVCSPARSRSLASRLDTVAYGFIYEDLWSVNPKSRRARHIAHRARQPAPAPHRLRTPLFPAPGRWAGSVRG